MRRLVLILLLLAVPALVLAQAHSPTNVAHGSEKVGAQAARGEGHGEAHEAPTFLGVPAWIFKLVNMLLFIGLLGWLLGKPIRGFFAERGAGIQRAAQEARERMEKADRVAGDIQARLTQLEQELDVIRERAEHDGERQKKEILAAAEAEAERILQNARAEVDNRLKNAKSELTEYAGQLASERAEQLLREKITPQDQAKLFRESLNEVEGARS